MSVRKEAQRLWGWLVATSLLVVLSGTARGATREPVVARRGMVAASHVLASQVGVDILRKGGNAVDAAVAVAFTMGVVEPQSGGLGGGGFALWYAATDHRVRALDFRERAPLGATPNMFLDAKGRPVKGASTAGYLAVGVPGTVAGLAELHRQGGRLPWKELVAPAIRVAEQGFVVGRRLHGVLSHTAGVLRRHPEAASTFLKRGSPYDVGDLLFQRDLADTLRTIQQEGAAGFYAGDVARAIATDMEEQGGLITLEDLQGYRPVWRPPLWGTYRGQVVVSFPPPSSGGVHLLQMLGFLSQEGVVEMGQGSAALAHTLVEAMRRAYADRAQWLGDPAYVDVPVHGLLSPTYLQERWRSYSPELATPSRHLGAGDPWPHEPGGRRAPQQAGTGAPPSESPDTAHFCVVDAERNAVALTFTLNTPMGAGVVVPGTGILLNNEMDDFSVAPGVPNAYGLVGGEANSVAPAKIPLSSMTPTLVFHGPGLLSPVSSPAEPALDLGPDAQLRLVVGAPGGSTIITTVLQVIINVVDFGVDVEQAVAAPRLHHQWRPDEVMVEGSMPPEVRRALFARGHTLVFRSAWGNATAIGVDESGLTGAADPRGEGVPAGY